MKRVVVPVADGSGLKSRLAEHFGRAPYFAVVELEEDGKVSKVEVVSNRGEHFGGMGHPHDFILESKPDAIIVYGMGPRGLSNFQNAGIAVFKANANTVEEVVAAYKDGKLQELTEGCHQAHHH